MSDLNRDLLLHVNWFYSAIYGFISQFFTCWCKLSDLQFSTYKIVLHWFNIINNKNKINNSLYDTRKIYLLHHFKIFIIQIMQNFFKDMSYAWAKLSDIIRMICYILLIWMLLRAVSTTKENAAINLTMYKEKIDKNNIPLRMFFIRED